MKAGTIVRTTRPVNGFHRQGYKWIDLEESTPAIILAGGRDPLGKVLIKPCFDVEVWVYEWALEPMGSIK